MTARLPGLLTIGAALSLAACSEVADSPTVPGNDPGPSLITFGTPDGGAHPNVGIMLFVQNGEGYYACTGTLASPTVMITAGHCVESEGNENSVTYVRFADDPLADRGQYRTTQQWLNAKWIKAVSVEPHPQYNDFAEFPNTYDVGVVILPRNADLPTSYAVLPEIDFLTNLTTSQGESKLFTAVGFGDHGVINPFEGGDLTRRYTTTMLIEAGSTRTGGNQSAKFSNNPGVGGGTCYGDSGGPIFYGSTNIIAAVTSFGYTECIGNDFNFRLDTRVAQDFLKQYLN